MKTLLTQSASGLGRMAMMIGCAWSLSAQAADAPDWLPDGTADTVTSSESKGNDRFFLEFAGEYAQQTEPSEARRHGDIGLDGYATREFGRNWSGVLSGRIEVDANPGEGLTHRNLSLTLREAYASGEVDGVNLDFGRISIRDGVAVGYNPTDVFRAGSLPVRRTEDPARLRESRLGVVGLRVQKSTPWGDVAGLISPRLSLPHQPSWYDPMWGAVNDGRGQLYFKYTPPRWHGVYASTIWHQSEGGGQTVGLNATNNFGQSVVAYVELARTRRARLTDLAQDAGAQRSSFSLLSAGASLSTASRQTITLEYAYNGGGVGRGDYLGTWQQATPERLGAAFGEAGRRQDPLGKHNLLLLLQWDRFGATDADLTCLARLNVSDRSRMGWCEWRYKQPAAEWSISATRLHGESRSEFGAARQPWAIGAKVRFFF